MRRTMFMLVFMGTTLALAAGVALAQDSRGAETSRGPVDFTLDATDCTGELIHVSGRLNAVFHIREDEDGSLHGNTHFNFSDVEGIGEVTGVTYRVPTVINSTQQITAEAYPIVIATDVTVAMTIGQGRAPDQQATSVIHFTILEDGTATAEVVQFRFECRS